MDKKAQLKQMTQLTQLTQLNQLNQFWGQLKAALSVHETVAHHQHLPQARLRQMESRSNAAILEAEAVPRGAVRPEAELIDSLASQRATVCDNQLRWSCNPDKGIKQEIRKGHQLSGVARGFSIDPLVD
ncbi:MAG: hypothetical protein KGS72_10740 [Cyanobacteria bacterium REEB67]|nr:hypothetical protein [Cyanobacteria bacterium REEB67]